MLPIKIELPDGFLDEEVRCGYTVSTEMKKLWAVELDLLVEFDRVCRKNDITYFVGFGTLLGAIRHQGFIPWDDDIDVIMYRDEYEKLTQIAEQEFQYPYFFHSPHTDPGLVSGGSRLRNSKTTLISDFEHKRPYQNKGIFIDVFVLDNLPDGEFWLKMHKLILKCYWRILRYASYYGEYFGTGKTLSLKKRFVGGIALALKRIWGIEQLCDGYTKLCSKYQGKSTKCNGPVEFSRGRIVFLKEFHDLNDITYVPFEHIKVPIPNCYDEILSVLYGDYMTMKKVPATHRWLSFNLEIPYKEYCPETRMDNVKYVP